MILDQFLHHAEIVRMMGRSHSLRYKPATKGPQVEASKPAKSLSGSEEDEPTSRSAKVSSKSSDSEKEEEKDPEESSN